MISILRKRKEIKEKKIKERSILDLELNKQQSVYNSLQIDLTNSFDG